MQGTSAIPLKETFDVLFKTVEDVALYADIIEPATHPDESMQIIRSATLGFFQKHLFS
ncbi:hypothetical protein [Dictyobacter arantiisoli]|uniref:Uncharacterized protein n=1 Tax=Dictyobacter arantiisoli TaxID=2014874 RepID=A0A5A5TF21_9CHLR|nr:hypothetical protein [Dictyobacter arantiisoli]GCF09937.1 hypothetical protein KDI_35010 [Dictyobacter arantiisoli]